MGRTARVLAALAGAAASVAVAFVVTAALGLGCFHCGTWAIPIVFGGGALAGAAVFAVVIAALGLRGRRLWLRTGVFVLLVPLVVVGGLLLIQFLGAR